MFTNRDQALYAFRKTENCFANNGYASGTEPRTNNGCSCTRKGRLVSIRDACVVFLNITGGIHIDDPAIDLAVVAAVLSSNVDIAIDKSICFAAEIGLAGEVRPVTRIEQRISEAEKLGYASIVISKYVKYPKGNHAINVIKVAKVHDVVRHLFG